MTRPKLLDLFSCEGGAGEGYARAGFDVTGVDIKPQPRNPHRFIQADALEYVAAHGHEYDAIHASPPCQAFTALRSVQKDKEKYDAKHVNLIPQTRALLIATGKPYIIENVAGARKELIEPVMLCGTMFGLCTKCGAELQRHRLFESNCLLMSAGNCRHGWCGDSIGIYGEGAPMSGHRRVIGVHGNAMQMKPEYDKRRVKTIGVFGHGAMSGSREVMDDSIGIYGEGAPMSGHRRRCITVTGNTPQQNVARNLVRKTYTIDDARDALGIPWGSRYGLSQAIPPAYTKFLGEQLRRYV